MSVSVWCKSLVFAAAFSLAAGALKGQGIQAARFSQTVSVSTLQVPAKAWKHFQKALSAADHNRSEESQQESTMALEIAPRFAKAYILRASQELHVQHYDAAIADAKAAAKIEPGVLWASVIVAGAYNSMHRYKDALLVLDALHGPESESWQADYERARAQVGSGDVEGALYWSALAIGAAPPSITDVLLVRSNAFLIAHRWEEAQAEIRFYLGLKTSGTHRDELLALQRRLQMWIDQEKGLKLASR